MATTGPQTTSGTPQIESNFKNGIYVDYSIPVC